MNLEQTCNILRTGAQSLALQNASIKNKALTAVAAALDTQRVEIIAANKKDVDIARVNGTSESLIDRLSLDDKRIDGIIEIHWKMD